MVSLSALGETATAPYLLDWREKLEEQTYNTKYFTAFETQSRGTRLTHLSVDKNQMGYVLKYPLESISPAGYMRQNKSIWDSENPTIFSFFGITTRCAKHLKMDLTWSNQLANIVCASIDSLCLYNICGRLSAYQICQSSY